ncbi:MAG TPA: AMP-binding protein [Bacteroidota bacterium]|nr:AMP-binding protein [Bacteroidota bacterium]
MSDALLRLYHRSPPALRSLIAGSRGYYLRAWRYGRDTEALVAEALERESWPPEKWAGWQRSRAAELLWRASRDVPFYRELWSARRRRGDARAVEYLEHWPVLEKETLRRDPGAFVAADRRRSLMFHEHTSGTTGKPLDVWFTRETVKRWYALFEARWRRWNGVSLADRWALLGGQLVAPVAQQKPPFWTWNAGLRQLYMSSYHLAPRFLPSYADALVRYRIRYLWGYASSLYALAQSVLREGRTDLRPVVAVTNAEPLYPHQREAIGAAFGCPVRETYGMTEIAVAAGECASGTMHLWPEVGIVEACDGDAALKEGETGELVCTGLLNRDMPLIRYRVGDRGALGEGGAQCSCGRTLPSLRSIEGRSDDVLLTADGRPVGRLDTVFKGSLPLREAQIIQDARDHVRILFVPSEGYTPESGRAIVARLQDRMGPVRVTLEQVERIPRSANGKFRAVVNSMGEAPAAAGARGEGNRG